MTEDKGGKREVRERERERERRDRIKTGLCFQFEKAGVCTNSGCRYRHEDRRGPDRGTPPKRRSGSDRPGPDKKCWLFGTAKGCKYGDDCVFLHDAGKSESDGKDNSKASGGVNPPVGEKRKKDSISSLYESD